MQPSSERVAHAEVHRALRCTGARAVDGDVGRVVGGGAVVHAAQRCVQEGALGQVVVRAHHQQGGVAVAAVGADAVACADQGQRRRHVVAHAQPAVLELAGGAGRGVGGGDGLIGGEQLGRADAVGTAQDRVLGIVVGVAVVAVGIAPAVEHGAHFEVVRGVGQRQAFVAQLLVRSRLLAHAQLHVGGEAAEVGRGVLDDVVHARPVAAAHQRRAAHELLARGIDVPHVVAVEEVLAEHQGTPAGAAQAHQRAAVEERGAGRALGGAEAAFQVEDGAQAAAQVFLAAEADHARTPLVVGSARERVRLAGDGVGDLVDVFHARDHAAIERDVGLRVRRAGQRAGRGQQRGRSRQGCLGMRIHSVYLRCSNFADRKRNRAAPGSHPTRGAHPRRLIRARGIAPEAFGATALAGSTSRRGLVSPAFKFIYELFVH